MENRIYKTAIITDMVYETAVIVYNSKGDSITIKFNESQTDSQKQEVLERIYTTLTKSND